MTEQTHEDRQAEMLGQLTAKDVVQQFEMLCESINIFWESVYLVDDMDGGSGKLCLSSADSKIADMLNMDTTLHEDNFYGYTDIFSAYLIGYGQLHDLANCYGRLKTILSQFNGDTKLGSEMEMECNNLMNTVYLTYRLYENSRSMTVMPKTTRNSLVYREELGTYQDFLDGLNAGLSGTSLPPETTEDSNGSGDSDDLVIQVSQRLDQIATEFRGVHKGITQNDVIWFLGYTKANKVIVHRIAKEVDVKMGLAKQIGSKISKEIGYPDVARAEVFRKQLSDLYHKEQVKQLINGEVKEELSAHPRYQSFVNLFLDYGVKMKEHELTNVDGDKVKYQTFIGVKKPNGIPPKAMALWLVENLEQQVRLRINIDYTPFSVPS